MAQSFEERLLDAIKRDDLKAFGAIAEGARVGALRLGRFPTLSLLYLFGARKILKAYEENFLKINAWEQAAEPASISALFIKKAGKCARLYLDEVVTPIEALMLLNKTAKVKAVYPVVRPSEAVRSRLKEIYFIRYALPVTFRGRGMEIPRRPLSRREKKRLALACVGIVLALAIIISVPAVTLSLVPLPSRGEITKLSQMDLASNSTYRLKKDIYVPKSFSVQEVNCTIIGEGHAITLEEGASLGRLNGALSDVKIVSRGTPVFTVCTNISSITDATLNVTAELEATESLGMLAIVNYGKISGLTATIGGNLSAMAEDGAQSADLIFGGIVGENSRVSASAMEPSPQYGTIENCTVTFNNFTLNGVVEANASFGGIAGINNGILQDCSVQGDISSDTLDIAGVCYVNGHVISRVFSEANLSQTSDDARWSPTIGGIVLENDATIEYCKNSGNISVTNLSAGDEESSPSALMGGIANENNSVIRYCRSDGDLSAQSASMAIAGGIAARNLSNITYCATSGDMVISASSATAGGIFGRSEVQIGGFYYYCGFADMCVSEMKFDIALSGDDLSCAGGIGGFIIEAVQDVSTGEGDGSQTMKKYIGGGGVTNCAFLGELTSTSNISYFGNIVGICGKDIYDKNSYQMSDGSEKRNFEGNLYMSNTLPVFGATIAAADSALSPVDPLGAEALSEAEIRASKLYNDIIAALNAEE